MHKSIDRLIHKNTTVSPFVAPDSGDDENGGLKLTVETITPAKAMDYLDDNISNNRPVSEQHVAALARDMVNGRWSQNGETLKFSPTGELLDGQQRLWACITANKAFTTAVVRGVESLDDVDRARPRTLAHALGMYGVKRSSKLGVVLNTTWRWENSNWRMQQLRPTIQEAMIFHRQHEALLGAAMRGGLQLREMEGSLENASLVFWRLARTCGQEIAEQLFTRLSKNDWQSLKDPLFHYHSVAIRAKAQSRKPHKLVKLNWLVRGLDAALNREDHDTYHFLRWNPANELRLFTGEELNGSARA